MGADGLGTEGKLEGYCFGSLTGCDQPKNFVFAVGEFFVGRPFCPGAQVIKKGPGNSRRNVSLTGERFFDGLDQFSGGGDLGEVSGGSGLQYAQSVLILGVGAKDENGKLWSGVLDFFEDLEAAAAGHADVQKHNIPAPLPGQFQGGLGGFGFAEAGVGEMADKNVFKTMAKHSVIVSYEDFHGARFLVSHASSRESRPNGMRTATVVPLLAAL